MPQESAQQLRQARVDGGAFRLPPRLLLRLSGADAFRYLNGQITRDLSRAIPGDAVQACILTPKGKLCAPLLIRYAGDDLLVEADPILEGSLLARLERYIVSDDVTLSIESPGEGETVHVFGMIASDEKWKEQGGILVSRMGVPGWDVGKTLMDTNQSLKLLDLQVVEALRIERGIPSWGSELSEETLPPEVGLDRTHIDYDRGCYPGQETISRLRSIGRVRRLLHTLHSLPGSPLYAGMHIIDEEKKEIGTIISAAEQFDTGAGVALAILPREKSDTLFARLPLTDATTPLSIMEIYGS